MTFLEKKILFNVLEHFFQNFGFLVVFARKVCINAYLPEYSFIVIQIKVNKKVLYLIERSKNNNLPKMP